MTITRDQYLSLLDLLGRMVRKGKRGSIPPELPPILERLSVDPQTWLDSILDFFRGNPPPRPPPRPSPRPSPAMARLG